MLWNKKFCLTPIQEPGEISQYLKWYEKQTSFSSECVINSNYVREASFAISHLIAKQLKPFLTGDLFLKSCWKLFHFISRFWNRDKNCIHIDQWQLSETEPGSFRAVSEWHQWMLFPFKFISMRVWVLCLLHFYQLLTNMKKHNAICEECTELANILGK